jgi:protein TonB
MPEPAPAPAEVDRSGVYPAVPAGGTQPEETDRVVPRYPSIARRAGVQGAVVVRGIVRRDGTIDDVEIIKDLPYGLGESAREAVSQWRFRPATFRGEAIDVYYTVTVNFRLQ